MKHKIFFIIGFLCLLFSGCNMTVETTKVKSTISAESGSDNEIPATTSISVTSTTTLTTNVQSAISAKSGSDNEIPTTTSTDIIGPGGSAGDIQTAANTAITAASGSAADIQAAANIVYAAGGGNVYIPAGDFNLNGTVTIKDNVKLIGAGINNTILRSAGYNVLYGQGNNLRFSGFSLLCSGTNTDSEGIQIGNPTVSGINFRVDNIHFEGYSYAGVWVRGLDSRGVIDHCYTKMRIVSDLGYGVLVTRENYWEDDMELGSANATFIEDCTFINCRHAVAANSGAHYVFRHNLCQQGSLGQQVDAHGIGNGSTEGTRCVEVYDNVINTPVSGGIGSAIFIRGGGGVIFDNTISGYKYSVDLEIDRGTSNGVTYPVKDQVHDMYIWNNPHDGTGLEVVVENSAIDFIKKNRDYFQYAKPGYTPYIYPHPLVLSTK